MAQSKVAIGIDLGTSSSAVGVWRNGKVEVIPNDQGQRSTPSYLAFPRQGGRLVGQAAKTQLVGNAKNTLHGFKALLGRDFYDPVVQEGIKNRPFEVINIGDMPNFVVEENGQVNYFTPEELTSQLLTYLKQSAEAYLNQKVTEAVITVPAGTQSFQVAALKKAAGMAGLKVIRVINDPIASALTYVVEQTGTEISGGEKNLLIFNMGGGTTGVSVITAEGGLLEVKATTGNPNLGGAHFTQKVIDQVAEEFREKFSVDIFGNPEALGRLEADCDLVKKLLSKLSTSKIDLRNIHEGQDFSTEVSQARFEGLCKDLFSQVVDMMVTNVLKEAKMTKLDIDEILLVGGSTRIPRIQNMLQEYFSGKELNKSIHLDEAPLHGAAILAAMLTGSCDAKIDLIFLLDVTPFSLGVETVGGVMTTLIPRNITFPTQQTQTFATTYDNQSAVIISVYEGERNLVKDNHLLGTFALPEITQAKAGIVKIGITFNLEADGSLVVIIVEKSTGDEEEEEKRVTIDPGSESILARSVIANNLINERRTETNQLKDYEKTYVRMNSYLEAQREGPRQGSSASADQKVKDLEAKVKKFKVAMVSLGVRPEAELSLKHNNFHIVSAPSVAVDEDEGQEYDDDDDEEEDDE